LVLPTFHNLPGEKGIRDETPSYGDQVGSILLKDSLRRLRCIDSPYDAHWDLIERLLHRSSRIGENTSGIAHVWDRREAGGVEDATRDIDKVHTFLFQPTAEPGVVYATLDELLTESDFVSLHVPLGPETEHLIGERELKSMKSTAILVNMARGPVVDPKALYSALKEGEIAGAALDVTDPEPLPTYDPLLGLDNLLITPHLGSASVQTRTRMAEMAAENLLSALRAETMPFSVFANP